jgi:glycosyltransferase involved in cell wall biosynthesis
VEQFKVSVIIPAFNVEKYIKRCLNSTLNQTYKHLQVIIIDDVSTDSTKKIIKEIADLDTRVKVLLLEQNSGSAVARQTGIDICDGELITFVDADDCYNDLGAIETVVKEFENEDIDCVMFSYRTVHGNAVFKKQFCSPEGIYDQKQAFIDKIKYAQPHWHYLWNKFYSADCIKNNDIKFCGSLRRAQDVKFNQDFLRRATKFKLITNQYFYDYNCSNANQITRKETSFTKSDISEQLKHLKSELHYLIKECDSLEVSNELESIIYTKFYKNMTNVMHRAYKYEFGDEVKLLILQCPEYQKSIEVLGKKKIVEDVRIVFNRHINIIKKQIKEIIN